MFRTLRRLIPSPAMIVALVALVMSLGGSAYATLMNGDSSPLIPGGLIEDNSIRGKKIRTHSLRGDDLHRNSVGGGAVRESALETVPSASGLELWAVVRANGVLDRDEGLAPGDVGRFDPPSTGLYQVIFDRNVDRCSYQATIGTPDEAIPTGNSQIAVSPLPDNPKGLLVRTANSADTVADRAFQLAVIC